MLETQLRRRLAKVIMIFGYTFTATIVSSVVTILLSLSALQMTRTYFYLFFTVVVFVLFMVIRRRKFYIRAFDGMINRFYCRHILRGMTNPVMVVEDYGESVIADVIINNLPDELDGVPLAQSDIRGRWGLLVLMIKPMHGEMREGGANSVIFPKDTVTVMGRRADIERCFNRSLVNGALTSGKSPS